MSDGDGFKTSNDLARPSFFADETFVRANEGLVAKYVEYRVKGYPDQMAFLRVFGSDYKDQYLHQRIDNLEHNVVYRKMFDERLKTIPVDELWNARISLQELLNIARSWFAKESTKLAAMRELNVLCGITVIDEQGRTKAGRRLEDFYTQHTGELAAIQRHPLPGTPEAEKFMEEARKVSTDARYTTSR
jgi:hypothetical protein